MIDSIKIELGGKERELRFDIGIMSDYEDLTGANALHGDIFTDITAKGLRALLFVVLKVNNTELTIDQCGKMVNASNMKDVISALAKAFVLGMPRADESKKKVE